MPTYFRSFVNFWKLGTFSKQKIENEQNILFCIMYKFHNSHFVFFVMFVTFGFLYIIYCVYLYILYIYIFIDLINLFFNCLIVLLFLILIVNTEIKKSAAAAASFWISLATINHLISKITKRPRRRPNFDFC